MPIGMNMQAFDLYRKGKKQDTSSTLAEVVSDSFFHFFSIEIM